MRRAEIKPLTTLRMVAALLVFLHHFHGVGGGIGGYPLHASFIQVWAVEGHVGVDIFFTLSGFLIALRYLDDIGGKNFSWSTYLRRRFARIYPLYFFVLLAVTIYKAATAALPPTMQIISQFTLTQGLFKTYLMSGVPTAWSLTVEESFYLLAPWVLLSLSQSRFKRRAGQFVPFALITLTLWTLGLFLTGYLLILLVNVLGWTYPTGFMADSILVLHYTIFGRFINFAVGIVAALIYAKTDWQQSDSAVRGYSLLAVAVIALWIGLVSVNNDGVTYPSWGYYVYFAMCSGGLILALTSNRTRLSRLLSLPALTYMGRISYAVYILQFTPIFLLLAPATATTLTPVLLYIVLNVIAALLYELVEKPAHRLLSPTPKSAESGSLLMK